MNLFGFNITRSKAAGKTQQSDWQLRPNDGQGPYTKFFANYIARKVEPTFYEFLREAIPVMDAAINRLVSLDGHLIVTGENDALVEEIQEWFYNVPVNDIQKGIQAFHQNFSNEAFEQGFSLGEYVTNKSRTDIEQLRVADSKYIKFKRNAASGLDIYQKADNDPDWRKLNPSPLLYFSINNENQNPYGTPLFRSCEFVAKVLATMHNSLLNVWERFGDPSYSIIYKTSRKDGNDLVARRQTIQDEFNTAIRAKREGKSADFVRAIDQNSEIAIDIIGANGQVLEMDVPARHVLEQIVAKSGLPSWMVGMHWSTTERLSDNEAEMLLADISTRQAAKMPYFYNLIRTLLLLRGRTWKKGDWKLEWAQVNLKDVMKQAQARFMNAQADMYDRQLAGSTLPNQGSRGQGFKDSRGKLLELNCHGEKELNRPTPWPELDKVETEYEDRLKSDCASLKDRIMTILKLSSIPGQQSAKDAPPDPLAAFTFTEEQRAAIMKALRDSINIYNPDDPDSPVRWYYAQSYSLGLIQAVKLIGETRPILDIIKNKEIYDELCRSGFTLVKDDATRLITDRIMPEMQAQMIAGTNPRHVASRLETLFGDANSDWERLARTEMTTAAERAKLDEWKEWKMEKVDFDPAPDACPACQALAGEYPIDQCPVPGRNTHPRCRCSIRPPKSEV